MLVRAVRQKISVVQIIDLDILDVVAIDNIHLPVDGAALLGLAQSRGRGRSRALGRLDRGNVDMLDALLSLELGVYPRGSGSYTKRG